MILKCKCSNAFQDKTYGRKLRVHNGCDPEGGKGANIRYRSARCTVCGNTRSLTADEAKKGKK